jgi:uridine kinase
MCKNIFTPKLIAIAGGSASGKTTVARRVLQQIGEANALILTMDAYYSDLSYLPQQERAHVNFDHPNAVDMPLFKAQVTTLKHGQAVRKPVYDFSTHTRAAKPVLVKPKKIIIIEGLFTLIDDTINRLYDMKVFVRADEDVRLNRRLKRDIEERGRTEQSVREQYERTVKPMHDIYVAPAGNKADIIIDWNQADPVAVAKIVKEL